MKKRENLHWNTDKGSVNILRSPAKTQKQARTHAARNYNFECDWLMYTTTLNVISDWLIELSDDKLSNNKLSNNNVASELVENGTFLDQSQSLKL